jgi:hypothetical protein
VEHSYPTGNRVFQTQYGHGTVTLVNEYHTVVDFDAHGPRTFATRLVQLEPSSEPAPPKVPKTRRRTKPRTQTSS